MSASSTGHSRYPRRRVNTRDTDAYRYFLHNSAGTPYLRKRYIDPMTLTKTWGLVPGPGGTIMGVYSLSEATPIKTGNFEQADKDFEGKTSYQDWKFVYTPQQQTPAPAVPPPGAGATPPALPTNAPSATPLPP